jgi:hypothetical protein
VSKSSDEAGPYGVVCMCPCRVRDLAECKVVRGQTCEFTKKVPAKIIDTERKILSQIADWARITGNREHFIMAGHWVILSQFGSFLDREEYEDEAFVVASTAVRAAADAVSALTKAQRQRIGRYLYSPAYFKYRTYPTDAPVDDPAIVANWPHFLSDLVEAFAFTAWKNPIYEARLGSGARTGRRADYPFRTLVTGLLIITNAFGGKLTFDHKGLGSGTLLKAINLLHHYSLFGQIIPAAPPLSTIRRVVEDFRAETSV